MFIVKFIALKAYKFYTMITEFNTRNFSTDITMLILNYLIIMTLLAHTLICLEPNPRELEWSLLTHFKCDCILENRPYCHISYFEKCDPV